ncbi:MAG: hypothetical protein WC289_05050 [Patescibacteria group bacterium]|jgi:hypothetical protein
MKHPPQGYIALTAILIILATTLAIAVSVSILTVDAGRLGTVVEKGGTSFSYAETCLEEALIQLRRDQSYIGGNLNIGDGSCTITVENDANRRMIISQGTIDGTSRTIAGQVSVSPEFIFESWQEK